jgi:hypothetical protein
MLVQARHNAFNSHNKPSRHRRHYQFSSSQQLHSVPQILTILHVCSNYNNNNNNSKPVLLPTVRNFSFILRLSEPELNNILEIDDSHACLECRLIGDNNNIL